MSSSTRRSDLVGKAYNMAYKAGISPWAKGSLHPELIDLIEGPSALQPGRAIDLGCGAGNASFYLAEQGWEVTGVDISEEVIEQARSTAEENSHSVEFVHGDLRGVPGLGLSGKFTLLLDIGCCHSLTRDERRHYAEALAGIADANAILYMFAFTRGPLSVTDADIERSFLTAWELVSAVPGEVRRTPDAGPVWYTLRPLHQ